MDKIYFHLLIQSRNTATKGTNFIVNEAADETGHGLTVKYTANTPTGAPVSTLEETLQQSHEDTDPLIFWK
jgi:hypothetical protein